MRNIIKATIVGSTLVASAFVAQPQAQAEWVTFSGLECVDARDTSPNVYYSDGAYNNSKLVMDTFHCPIARPTSLSAARFQTFVRVRDNSPNKNVRCRVRRCNALGTSCVISPYVASSGQGVRSLFLGNLTAFSLGNAQIQCVLPRKIGNSRRSGVLNYSIND